MAAESFLVQSLSTLITEFNRRAIQYALAGGWAFSALFRFLDLAQSLSDVIISKAYL